MSDEDGLNMNGGITTGNTTATWDLTVNSQGPVNNVQWGMWVDWNTDGVFDDFFHDSVNTNSPVTVPISVTSPANIALNYIVRAGVKTGAAVTAGDYSLQIANGEWEDFIAAPIPLGVTLLSFTATKQTPVSALLQWKTAHEAQSDYFIVERSADARVWTEAGRVKAAVKSETELNYSLTDYVPLPGINYYRLRMVDRDGRYRLSAVRRLDFGNRPDNSIAIVPNPAHDVATVVFAHPVAPATTLKIWNPLGQAVYPSPVPAMSRSYTIGLPAVAPGIYQVEATADGVVTHVKLVIQ